MNMTRDQYPKLETTPEGRSTAKDADLTPRQSVTPSDDDTVFTEHGSMVSASDASPSLPLRGQQPPGDGPTNTSHAEQTARRLDRDLLLRDAIEADGQDPDTFRLDRGVSSGRGVNEPTGKTGDDLREELLRADGRTDMDIELDRMRRGR